jgi:hypothetical protein
VSREEDRWVARRRRARIRKMLILVRHYFVGLDRELLELLLTSVTPVEDFVKTHGVDERGAYRRVQYLARVMTTYEEYFKKRTYKKARVFLEDAFNKTNMAVIEGYLRCRSIAVLSKFLRSPRKTVEYHVDVVETMLAAAPPLPEVEDFREFWHALRGERMSYHESW